jgi:MFS family permease
MSSKAFITVTVGLGVFIDTFAYGVVLPFFPQLVNSIGGEEKDVGIILSLFSIGLIVGSLVFGFISDWIARRKLLMILGLAFLILSTVLMMFIRTYWSLCVGRFFQGFSSGSIWVLGLALIADTTSSGSDVGVTMAWVFSAFNLGQFVGPLVGGYLYELGEWLPYLSIVILSVIDLIMRLMINEDQIKLDLAGENPVDESEVKKPVEKRTMKSMIASLIGNRLLWLVLGLTSACGIFAGATEVAFTLQLVNHYGLSSGNTGLSFLAIIVPQIIAAPIGGHYYDKYGYRKVVLPGLTLSALLFFLVGIDMPLYGLLTTLGVVFGIVMFSFSPLLPEIMRVVDADSYALAYGIFNCFFAIGLFVGPIVGSVIFQFTSFQVYAFVMAGFLLCSVPFVYFYKPVQVSDQVEEKENVIVTIINDTD